MNKKLVISLALLFFLTLSMAQDNEEDNDQDKRPSWSPGLPERQTTKDLSKPEFKPEIDDELELDMSEFGIKPKSEIDIELPIGSELPVVDEKAAKEEQERLEQERLEQERLEQERLEQERLEQERLEQERLEQERLEQERLEQERLEQERLEQERLEQERLEQERLEQERLEQERLEQERLEQELLEQERLEQERLEQEQATESQDSAEPMDIAPKENETNALSPGNVNSGYTWKITKQAPVEYPVKAAIDNLEGWVDLEVTINAAGEVVSATPVKYSRKGRIFGKPAIQSVNDWLFEPPSNSGINEPQTRIYRIEFNL
ncbi:MAG: TonB family protein [Marinicella sp.]